MPLIRGSAPVIYPDENSSLVKYFDLTKFIFLLQTHKLFFCRLDKLDDKYEGTMPENNFAGLAGGLKEVGDSGFFEEPPTDDEIQQMVRERFKFQEQISALTCVNCWNLADSESAALWKIYAENGKGIMIKSSMRNVEAALQATKEEIRISKVNYIDYKKDAFDPGNTIAPIIHKHKAYAYESEVRLIHEVSTDFGWVMIGLVRKFHMGSTLT